ncbi:hypothetical protein [Kitasatospora purpeofusca]|uniref:hypothetical protein n=1 Tax=Kitasatospora purpeofusca TaxID=67352 RepID=UPI003648252B
MRHKKPHLGIVGPVVYSAVIVGGAFVALAVGWPIRHGPLAPWFLVVGLVFTAVTVGALPVSEKWVRRRQGSEP